MASVVAVIGLSQWGLALLCFCHVVMAVPNATNFESPTLSNDPRLNPSVGNGYLATTVYSDTVYVSGIYNGRSTETPSHRARIPSASAIVLRTNLSYNEGINEMFSLNVEQGVFYYRLVAGNFTLEQRIYAHRVHEHILVTEVTYKNMLRDSVSLNLTNNLGPPSADIEFKRVNLSRSSVENPKVKAMAGYIKITEEPGSAKLGVAEVWCDIPSLVEIQPSPKTQTLYFVTAIATSLDAKDFVTSAHEAYKEAMQRPEMLLGSHVKAWKQLWDAGRIEVEGNLTLAQTVSGSLYYTLR